MAVMGSAHAETVELTGQLVSYGGDPITVGRVFIEGEYYGVDDNGRFTADVESNSRTKIAFYKGSRSSFLAPIRNGVPHVRSLGHWETDSGRDIGTVSLPQAYFIQIRALDADGQPVEDAEPGVRHGGYGVSDFSLTTNENGYLQIRDTDFDGIELRGRVKTSITIPTDGSGSIAFEERIRFDSPKTVVFQVGEGVTVQDSSSTTASPTSSPTSSPTPQEPTQSAAPTVSASPTSTRTAQPTSPGGEPPSTKGSTSPTATREPRGFFSNGNPGELAFLSNPLTLTIGGFVLSVAGIAHQMLRGA